MLNHVVEYDHVELLVVWFTIFTQRLKGKFLQTTTQDINGQCEYNDDLRKVARNMMGPSLHKRKLVKLQVPVKLMCGKYYGERIKI